MRSSERRAIWCEVPATYLYRFPHITLGDNLHSPLHFSARFIEMDLHSVITAVRKSTGISGTGLMLICQVPKPHAASKD